MLPCHILGRAVMPLSHGPLDDECSLSVAQRPSGARRQAAEEEGDGVLAMVASMEKGGALEAEGGWQSCSHGCGFFPRVADCRTFS